MKNFDLHSCLRGSAAIAMLASIVWLSGCASDSSLSLGPTAGDSSVVKGVIRPLCQAGCVDTDPTPDADGYFLGSSATFTLCTNGTQTDSDQDGLSDFCERNLALKFAPELFYLSYDEVGREPKWVAQREDNMVRIAYLLSYYRDPGSSTYVCSLPWAPSSCHGHNGDSELIALDVTYDVDSHHWVLVNALLSQHGGIHEFNAVGCTYLLDPASYCVRLTYPDVVRGYPRVWVSQGKHANYGDNVECENGAFADTDTCDGNNAYARVFVSAAYNLGSRSHHSAAQDCMASVDPAYQYYGSGKIECYWTTQEFRGWIPLTVGGPASTAYSQVLAQVGF